MPGATGAARRATHGGLRLAGDARTGARAGFLDASRHPRRMSDWSRTVLHLGGRAVDALPPRLAELGAVRPHATRAPLRHAG